MSLSKKHIQEVNEIVLGKRSESNLLLRNAACLDSFSKQLRGFSLSFSEIIEQIKKVSEEFSGTELSATISSICSIFFENINSLGAKLALFIKDSSKPLQEILPASIYESLMEQITNLLSNGQQILSQLLSIAKPFLPTDVAFIVSQIQNFFALLPTSKQIQKEDIRYREKARSLILFDSQFSSGMMPFERRSHSSRFIFGSSDTLSISHSETEDKIFQLKSLIPLTIVENSQVPLCAYQYQDDGSISLSPFEEKILISRSGFYQIDFVVSNSHSNSQNQYSRLPNLFVRRNEVPLQNCPQIFLPNKQNATSILFSDFSYFYVGDSIDVFNGQGNSIFGNSGLYGYLTVRPC